MTTVEYPTLVEWVAALRSGEYRQGRSRLRNEYGQMCCLGVYADLCVKKGLGHWGDGSLWESLLFLPAGAPPDRVAEAFTLPQEWDAPVRGEGSQLGIRQEVAVPNESYRYKRPVTLTYLNDGSKYTFEQIAASIESTFT